MLAQLLEYCTSSTGLTWLILWSDLAIAISYFAIPFVMLVVLRDRRRDIPYPWLWTLFVTFIVACGLTHVVHIMSALMGVPYLGAAADYRSNYCARVGRHGHCIFDHPSPDQAPAVAQTAARAAGETGGRAYEGEGCADPRDQSPCRQPATDCLISRVDRDAQHYLAGSVGGAAAGCGQRSSKWATATAHFRGETISPCKTSASSRRRCLQRKVRSSPRNIVSAGILKPHVTAD